MYKWVYPQVWELAKVYLAIPATSAPVERLFSSAGGVISSKRCGLDAETARGIVFVKENQQHFAPGHIPEPKLKREKTPRDMD